MLFDHALLKWVSTSSMKKFLAPPHLQLHAVEKKKIREL